MSRPWTFAVLAMLTASTGSAFAAQRASHPSSNAAGAPTLMAKPRKNLYAKLFQPSVPSPPRPQRRSESNRKVICGLTILEGDPTIDRGIAVKPPKTDVQFKIRKIEPNVCRD